MRLLQGGTSLCAKKPQSRVLCLACNAPVVRFSHNAPDWTLDVGEIVR